jgi:hypothetical protein
MKIRNPFRKRKEAKAVKKETQKLEEANRLALEMSLTSQLIKSLSRNKPKKKLGTPHPTRHKKRRKLTKIGRKTRKMNYKKAKK